MCILVRDRGHIDSLVLHGFSVVGWQATKTVGSDGNPQIHFVVNVLYMEGDHNKQISRDKNDGMILKPVILEYHYDGRRMILKPIGAEYECMNI